MLCSWAKYFPLTVPLSTQVYKWVLGNCQGSLTKCWGGGGGNLAMDCHPFQGEVAIFLVASCYMETSLSSGWVGQQAHVQTLSLNNDLLQAIHSKLIQMREQFH